MSILLAGASGAASPAGGDRQAPVQLAQLIIEQRVIIRIPTVRAPAPPNLPAPPEEPSVREVKGPKCLKLKRIRGAAISQANGRMTMVTDRDERFHAHFSRMCRSADFYAGFYIEPNDDGDLCAGRDVLHARNGSSCDIERFSRLVPDD